MAVLFGMPIIQYSARRAWLSVRLSMWVSKDNKWWKCWTPSKRAINTMQLLRLRVIQNTGTQFSSRTVTCAEDGLLVAPQDVTFSLPASPRTAAAISKNSSQWAALNAKTAKCVALPGHKYSCFSFAAVVCAISKKWTLFVRLQVRSNLLLDH